MNNKPLDVNTCPEEIDSRMTALSNLQLSILSEISCGTSAADIRSRLNVRQNVINEELENIFDELGVSEIKTAVRYYTGWIQKYDNLPG